MTTTTKRFAKTEAEARRAIQAGTARLTTFTGEHKVVGICPEAVNNIVTNNHGSFLYQQSWAGDWSQIEIVDN